VSGATSHRTGWGRAVDPSDSVEAFQAYLGIRFEHPDRLREALTHSSAKSPEMPCNERLEFLGDSILGTVIADRLFRDYPDFDEGELTQVKSEVVSSRTLARVGKNLGFEKFIAVGKGLKKQRGLPPSLVAGVMEALFGAIHLDQGMEAARAFILRCLESQIEAVLANRHRKNYKSILQNYTQKVLGITPGYRVTGESGPDHGKTFEVEVRMGNFRFAPGRGRSKKEAEQQAAENAYVALTGKRKRFLPVRLSQAAYPVLWNLPGGIPRPRPPASVVFQRVHAILRRNP